MYLGLSHWTHDQCCSKHHMLKVTKIKTKNGNNNETNNIDNNDR